MDCYDDEREAARLQKPLLRPRSSDKGYQFQLCRLVASSSLPLSKGEIGRELCGWRGLAMFNPLGARAHAVMTAPYAFIMTEGSLRNAVSLPLLP